MSLLTAGFFRMVRYGPRPQWRRLATHAWTVEEVLYELAKHG